MLPTEAIRGAELKSRACKREVLNSLKINAFNTRAFERGGCQRRNHAAMEVGEGGQSNKGDKTAKERAPKVERER